jgi:hypothetical protein
MSSIWLTIYLAPLNQSPVDPGLRKGLHKPYEVTLLEGVDHVLEKVYKRMKNPAKVCLVFL